MNAAIEFHDSVIEAVVVTRDGLIVRLRPAYVHRSDGRPGFDRGEGWRQEIDLEFPGGTLEAGPSSYPCQLCDGTITTGAQAADHLLPVPLQVKALVVFEAFADGGERLIIRGEEISVMPVREAVYVEEFPGVSR